MQNKVMARAKEKLEPREFNNMMRDITENALSNCDTEFVIGPSGGKIDYP